MRTIAGFEALNGLPYVMAALDGTFIRIKKPSTEYGDTFFCYKQHIGVLVLAAVDSTGKFLFVDAGKAYCANLILRLHQLGNLCLP
jgi:hypothetical protein